MGGWQGELRTERTIPCTDHSIGLSSPLAPWAVEAQMEG